jgi:hypothetical protein
MDLPKAYNEVSNRSLEASDAALLKGLQEYSGFLSYHAFESAGGALCSASQHRYPLSHTGKLNAFMAAAHKRGKGLPVAILAIQLKSLRNQLLYPEPKLDGTVAEPRDILALSMADKLKKRVAGIVRWVQANT